LQVSIDPDHKFELAIQLGKLEQAHNIAKEAATEQKWKQLSDLALASNKLDLVEQCLLSAEDIGGLLLLYSCSSNAQGLENLAKVALEKGKNNVAFVCYFLLRRLPDCLNLLCDTGRIPEAAFLARTYLPSQVSRIVKLWKADLRTVNEKAAESLADPMEYENLFPDIGLALKAEKYFQKDLANKPASAFLQLKDDIHRDLIEEIRSLDPKELEHLESAVEEPVRKTEEAVQAPQKPTQASPPQMPTQGSPPQMPNQVSQRATPAAQKIAAPQTTLDDDLDDLEDRLEKELADDI